jgi:hypothetical protein
MAEKHLQQKKPSVEMDEISVARFFFVQHTKTGQIYQNDHKNTPNGSKYNA